MCIRDRRLDLRRSAPAHSPAVRRPLLCSPARLDLPGLGRPGASPLGDGARRPGRGTLGRQRRALRQSGQGR
eukprot:11496148-Alexandrium_andersonii.AAC.1